MRGHEGRLDSGGWATVAPWSTELPPDTPGLALVSDMTKRWKGLVRTHGSHQDTGQLRCTSVLPCTEAIFSSYIACTAPQ